MGDCGCESEHPEWLIPGDTSTQVGSSRPLWPRAKEQAGPEHEPIVIITYFPQSFLVTVAKYSVNPQLGTRTLRRKSPDHISPSNFLPFQTHKSPPARKRFFLPFGVATTDHQVAVEERNNRARPPVWGPRFKWTAVVCRRVIFSGGCRVATAATNNTFCHRAARSQPQVRVSGSDKHSASSSLTSWPHHDEGYDKWAPSFGGKIVRDWVWKCVANSVPVRHLWRRGFGGSALLHAVFFFFKIFPGTACLLSAAPCVCLCVCARLSDGAKSVTHRWFLCICEIEMGVGCLGMVVSST